MGLLNLALRSYTLPDGKDDRCLMQNVSAIFRWNAFSFTWFIPLLARSSLRFDDVASRLASITTNYLSSTVTATEEIFEFRMISFRRSVASFFQLSLFFVCFDETEGKYSGKTTAISFAPYFFVALQSAEKKGASLGLSGRKMTSSGPPNSPHLQRTAGFEIGNCLMTAPHISKVTHRHCDALWCLEGQPNGSVIARKV